MRSPINPFATLISVCAAAFMLSPITTSDHATRRDAARLGQGGSKWKQQRQEPQEVPSELRAVIINVSST